MSIGERILELRNEKCISQHQLSKLMNVSRQAVSKWENDQSEPDTIHLIRLADVLDTDIEFLASGRTKQISSPAPIVTVERVVEKPIEIVKTKEVIKEVPVEIIREIVVEKPVIRKIFRTKYVRNPIEFTAMLFIGLIVGICLGLLIA